LAAPISVRGQEADPLKRAPAGAFAVIVVDVPKVMALPAVQEMQKQGAEMPPAFDELGTATFYLVPGGGEPLLEEAPSVAAVVTMKPGGRAHIGQLLAGSESEGRPGGLASYHENGMFFAVADDSTLLMGSTEEMLSALVEAPRAAEAKALPEQFRDLLKHRPEAAMYGAFLLSSPLGDQLHHIHGMPEWTQGIRAGALDLVFGDTVSGRAFLRTGSPEAATGAVEDARVSVQGVMAEINKQMRKQPAIMLFAQPLFAVLSKVQFEAEGADFRVALELTQQEFQGAFGSMVMVALAMRLSMRGEAEASEGGRADILGGDQEGPALGAAADLHSIGLGIAMWRKDHDGAYPTDLEALLNDGYLESEAVFVDPQDPKPVQRGKKGFLYSYEYVGAIPGEQPENLILAYSRQGAHADGRIVLYVDLAVEFVSEKDLHQPGGTRGMSLVECYKSIVDRQGQQIGDDLKARLRTFYEVPGAQG
jgi:hypothetical protein